MGDAVEMEDLGSLGVGTLTILGQHNNVLSEDTSLQRELRELLLQDSAGVGSATVKLVEDLGHPILCLDGVDHGILIVNDVNNAHVIVIVPILAVEGEASRSVCFLSQVSHSPAGAISIQVGVREVQISYISRL